MKTCPETGSPYGREHPDHWIGVTAEDIPQGWMDDMIKRLFEVANRDLIRLETAQIKHPVERGPDNNPVPEQLEKIVPEIEKRQRLLAKLQGTIERLSAMELKRQPDRKVTRKQEAAVKNGEAKRELKRRITNAVVSRRSGNGPAAAE